MGSVSLAPTLSPQGRLALVEAPDAPPLDPEIARHLVGAFARGPGHGLLRLGAAESGATLPPLFSYWREFGACYVTALCAHPDTDAVEREVPVAAPPVKEFDRLVLAAPPMTGAEYLSTEVLVALWQELDSAFRIELAESKCGIQEFLKRRNPAWNLVGRVHFNLAENRKDPDAPFRFSGHLHHAVVGQCQGATSSAGEGTCANTPEPQTRTVCCLCCFPYSGRRRPVRG